jgi:hypothetical protein
MISVASTIKPGLGGVTGSGFTAGREATLETDLALAIGLLTAGLCSTRVLGGSTTARDWSSEAGTSATTTAD